MARILGIIGAIMILWCMPSCDKQEHQLEGKWLLTRVEESGEITPVDTVWYNFQTSLFQYQIYDKASNTYKSCYGYKVMSDDHSLDLELTFDYEAVQEFLLWTDWEGAKRHFIIESISHRELRLLDGERRYCFSRF